jgi:hypothetical protein
MILSVKFIDRSDINTILTQTAHNQFEYKENNTIIKDATEIINNIYF